ncbi:MULTISPECIES: hypothetical protein [Pseudomonas]|uniref:Protein singed n=1 Tax=Pseudomonas donghuensis TaxID=1163398 RepID=A0AAP0XAB2_9PSED|nr:MULTISPECIES: hypothetical protein [Pseudomonas]KDN98916.1 hypothetical protein BV82_3076 [Pseudomonas donghuensis]MCP6691354.1 hypothetical protein [Pseudomonas donghuensis]MDF9893462.1 hypothetical protein [Pseudomonas vranovensis]QHF28576.1 hypothetical protein PspR32_12485 [Pseudomonas sp. R32]
MTAYVSIEQVDALLGADWAPDEKKPRAVLMANTWLTNLGLPAFDPVPDDVVQAGAEIAREAAAGNIFAAKETGVLSKSVDADGVSSSKTYSASARKISAGESFALALLSQYLGTGQAKIVRG